MSAFQEEIIKILLDKMLLGLVAAVFGFYLARLLEDYRTKKSYDTFLMQQRLEYCMRAISMVARHFRALTGMYKVVEKVAEKYPDRLTDGEAIPAYDYIQVYEDMKQEAGEIMPLLQVHVVDALTRYIKETGVVAAVIKGNFDGGWPNLDELQMAHTRFLHVCNAVLIADPFREPEIDPSYR